MSAFVVDKAHIDLLVRAAEHYGRTADDRFRWWRPDENGDFAGWRELDPFADGDDPERLTRSQLGQILVDENVRSVHHRYPRDNADLGELPGPIDAYYLGPYVYDDPGFAPEPDEVFAAIDCLDYQSCETDDWRRTEAFMLLEALRGVTCKAVGNRGEVPSHWSAEDLCERRGAPR